jgi:fibronectin-binding autotransporter adhesin
MDCADSLLPPRSRLVSILGAVGMVLGFLPCSLVAQTTFFWNGGDPTANPAGGGTGVWSTTNAWRTGTTDGALGTWAAGTGGTNAAVLGGIAGTITLGTSGSTNFTGSSLTVNTTGYIITSTSNSRNLVMTGALTTGAGVSFTIDQNSTGQTWGFSHLSLGSGSILTLQGAATANNANRVNLTGGTTSSGGNIVLAGSGTGVTGFVSNSGTSTLNINILNNSATSATMLGATSGNALVFGGVLSGSAHLQISAGQAGGAGIVTMNTASTYTGDTYLNMATNGVFRMGVFNALPSGTTLFMGASAGGGTSDNGGSVDLNGNDLSIGGLEKATTSGRGVGNNTSTLATLTIGKASGTNTFNGVIGTVANTNMTTQSNNIALVKTGGSTQILGNANTYTGNTTINEGILALVSNDHNNLMADSPAIQVGAGATFDVSGISASGGFQVVSGQTLGGSGTVAGATTVLTGGQIAGGAVGGGLGNLTFSGNLTTSSGSTWLIDLVQDANGQSDRILGGGAGSALSLGGATLSLNQINAFTPGTGYVWTIASNFGGGISGTFVGLAEGATVNSNFIINYGTVAPGAITLTAIPEPGALGLLGLALGGLAARRLRRRK